MSSAPAIPASRILVVLPNWLGDAVMATPFFRALRNLYPQAHITALARPLVASVAEGHSGIDTVKAYSRREEAATVRWLRESRFDLGILLPNSFRTAWLLWRGGIKHRLGYARGGRSFLLTDTIPAQSKSYDQRLKDSAKVFAQHMIRDSKGLPTDAELKEVHRRRGRLLVEFSYSFQGPHSGDINGGGGHIKVPYPGPGTRLPRGFHPVPTIDYYLELARYLGAPCERRMQVGITPAETAEGLAALASLNILPGEPLVLIVPGANFGSSKCWLPERFAQVADRLADPAGPFAARVLLVSGPSEMPIMDAILAASRAPAPPSPRVQVLASLNGGRGISIGALKEIVRRATLMLCNDTGPRHLAAAFDVPAVTLFGPTDPIWAETFAARERIIRHDVPCGPCQLKICPIDHRCMRGIGVDEVLHAIMELWPHAAAAAHQPAQTGAAP